MYIIITLYKIKRIQVKKLVLTLNSNFENLGKNIILPVGDDRELSLYLSSKLDKEVTFITYDSLSQSKYYGYITTYDQDNSESYIILSCKISIEL